MCISKNGQIYFLQSIDLIIKLIKINHSNTFKNQELSIVLKQNFLFN